MTYKTDDLRIIETNELSSPEEVRKEIPIEDEVAKTVHQSRQSIENILDNKDDRLIVVVGPCSIHDPNAALEYAKKLSKVSNKHKKNLYILGKCVLKNTVTPNYGVHHMSIAFRVLK